jgi:signal transduction histidine kinase
MVSRRGSTAALLVRVVILAVLYYAAAKLSLRLSLVDQSVTPVWPPSGLAVVWLLFFGRSSWPGIALGAFAVNLSLGMLPASGIAAGNTVAPVLAVVLLERTAFRPQLDRLRDAVILVFAASLGAMAISASSGTATLFAAGEIGSSELLSTMAVWWTGDAMGVLIFAPFLFALLTDRSRIRWNASVDALLWILLVGVVTTAVFQSHLQLLYLPFPLLGWIAFRYPMRVAAAGAMVASSVAVAAAVQGIGPFEGKTLLDQMVTLQVFNASAAFTSFVLSAIFAERAAAMNALQAAGIELETRVHEKSAALDQEKGRLDLHKREFVATAAHELRTPAAAISGLSSLLDPVHAAGKVETQEIVRRLARQSERLVGLVETLVDATQLEVGRLSVHLEPVDVGEIMAAAVVAAQPDDSISIVTMPPPPGTLALADAGRLEQTLINLLTNAFRYGGRQVTVESVIDRGEVLFAVSDDGPGIDEGFAPHLFEPFRRSGDRPEAVGLGLAIVRGLVASMGGRVWYEPVKPHGSRFVVAVPAAGSVRYRPAAQNRAAV